MKKNYIISAAGGNNTAIAIMESALTRDKYEEIGSKILHDTERRGVEQVGFLVASDMHFEMSGGEFCGNAARCAAFLLFQIIGKNEFSFTISGFDGKVEAKVALNQSDSTSAVVSCYFNGLKPKSEEKIVGSTKVSVVDLGGIVHCLIHDDFPKNTYKEKHNEIVTSLNLKDRLAVGVIWLSKTESGIRIDPIVWVKSIDTFFHETSCGSGSIATAVATGVTSVLQPSGQFIQVDIDDGGIQLTSVVKEEVSYNNFSYVTLDKSNNKTESFFKGFSDLYIEAFSEEPYKESYDEKWVYENVWENHLKEGIIVLALDEQKVIGLSCSLPLTKSVSPLDFINGLKKKPFGPGEAIYMSEIAVNSKYRHLGIGSELVKGRLEWARREGYKYFVMRTAAVGSNSFNLYKRMGANEIAEKQNVKDIPTEVESASTERIYLYGEL